MKKLLLNASALLAMSASISVVYASTDNFNQAPICFESEAILTISNNQHSLKAPAYAAETTDELDFTYAHTVHSALSFGSLVPVGQKAYQAIEFTSDLCNKYEGQQITSFNIVSGINGTTRQNAITDVTVFVADDLDQEFKYTQSGKLGTSAYTLNKITLDSPITIEKNKPFIIGYYCTPGSTRDYYATYDNIPTNNLSASYVGYMQGNTIKWDNLAQSYGALNIGVTIKGGSYIQNSLSVFECETPDCVFPNEPFDLKLTVCNDGAGEAKSIEIQVQVGDGQVITASGNLNPSITYNGTSSLKLSDLVCESEGAEIPLKIKLTKVNGVENNSKDNTFETNLVCFNKENGMSHNFVVEEATGTWCVWCPSGIVMMDYLKKNFPDRVIRIAVHGSRSTQEVDPMAISATNQILSYFSGFPMAMIDRSTFFTPTTDNVLPALSEFFNESINTPSIAGVDKLDVVFGENNKVNISTDVKFAIDMDNANRYRLAFYITEDGVGPYDQSNIYSTGNYGTMGGWESKGNPVSTYFDDVVRYLVGGRSGLTNSLPTKLEKNTAYNYSFDYTIPNVNSQYFYVTALIIDSKSNTILNARQITASKTNAIESNEIAENPIIVNGVIGGVEFIGNFNQANVFTPAGQLVATTTDVSHLALAPGLYIINVDGKSFKVIAK